MRNLGAVVSSPPKGSQPGAVGRVDRWFETVIAFARLYPCGIETAIAFAGAKWAFLVQFSGADGGVWVFRTVCFERVVLSSPGCLWPGRMDDHEEVLEAHA